jgi:hypothetical protein
MDGGSLVNFFAADCLWSYIIMSDMKYWKNYYAISLLLENSIYKRRRNHRKQMKGGYSKVLYHQRNKDETTISVIKRLFGEYLTSRLIRTQNRELSFRCLAYNIHRLTNIVIMSMFSSAQLWHRSNRFTLKSFALSFFETHCQTYSFLPAI